MVVRTTTPTITPAVPVKQPTAPAPEPEAAEPGFVFGNLFQVTRILVSRDSTRDPNYGNLN